jgi:two-component system LytT family response regulator
MNAILICDREVNLILVDTINKYCPDVSVVKVYDASVEELKLDATLSADVVLSDLCRQSSTPCNFIVSSPSKPELLLFASDPKDALHAFACDALHCLLLPVEPQELIHALHKASLQRQLRRDAHRGSVLASGLKPKKICLHSKDGVDIVKHDDILYCSADGAYCLVVTVTGRHLLSKTLSEVERQLQNEQFVRIHASHIINMSHVGRYVKSDGGSIVLDDGTVLPLSRRRRQEFLDQLPGY